MFLCVDRPRTYIDLKVQRRRESYRDYYRFKISFESITSPIFLEISEVEVSLRRLDKEGFVSEELRLSVVF